KDNKDEKKESYKLLTMIYFPAAVEAVQESIAALTLLSWKQRGYWRCLRKLVTCPVYLASPSCYSKPHCQQAPKNPALMSPNYFSAMMYPQIQAYMQQQLAMAFAAGAMMPLAFPSFTPNFPFLNPLAYLNQHRPQGPA
ncbi:unnamed protein product, partial [Mesorhabditis spiculigera]